MIKLLENAEHWEQRARETQKLADSTGDADERRLLLELVVAYSNLAERVRKRLACPQ